MAYNMVVTGIEELTKMLQKMGDDAQKVASMGLYEGAGEMANEMESQANSIETEPFHYAVFLTRQPSPEEKAVLLGKAGIAKFDKNGTEVNTAVGYGNAGYAMIAGRRKPVPKIANAINSGTSFMPKQPFVRRAAANGGPRASQKIVDYIEKAYEAMTK